jgi:glycosyltransferase involved in cell wall biosynthesis
MALRPEDSVFAVLCFEGPDRYASAGGLGTRISGLTQALAEAGAETHLYFVGDPEAPGEERRAGGRLVLHRWCQWISRYYPQGVYQGEEQKLYDYNESVPPHVLEHVVRPALARDRRVFVLGEDWHTAEAICRCSDLLHEAGLRPRATFVWNANNPMGFDRIDWGRLSFVANLTTVSRYMKHYMWRLGCNPLVVPNGIPEGLLAPVPEADAARLRDALRGGGPGPTFVKVARWDPDKRWLMAVRAVARLREDGIPARLVAKGGIEPHQAEVFATARSLGLRVEDVDAPNGADAAALADALAGARGEVVNLRGHLGSETLQTLYAAADAVLAQSGMEPFGLVGLEAMAAGALVFTGATGEDYARPWQNAVVLETDDPGELARYWRQLEEEPGLVERLRRTARATAAEYTWTQVLGVLWRRLDYLASECPR